MLLRIKAVSYTHLDVYKRQELEEAEGKALVDEIREWCRQNAEKDFDSLCYQKGNDYWILYRNKAASGLSIWCEPELTEKMELKVRVCYTYPPVVNQVNGVWLSLIHIFFRPPQSA